MKTAGRTLQLLIAVIVMGLSAASVGVLFPNADRYRGDLESWLAGIAGRTGLVDEDYDQLITVTPKLSDSLPLMPIWLVEKVLHTELFDRLFAYQYTVTGSWDEPSVTRIVIENDFPSDRS